MSILECSEEFKSFITNCVINETFDTKLFLMSMVHPSYAYENNMESHYSYEKLEFFGDAVLKLVVSEILYEKYEDLNEGILTKIRGEVVSDRVLADFSLQVGLNKFILLSKGEINCGGLNRPSILACAFEAFLGAMYLSTKNNLKIVKDFIVNNFENSIIDIAKNIDSLNPKAALQEYTQEKFKVLPQYVFVSRSGSEHDLTFEFDVLCNNEFLAKGFGSSKKNAQQDAAKNAIEKINKERKWQL